MTGLLSNLCKHRTVFPGSRFPVPIWLPPNPNSCFNSTDQTVPRGKGVFQGEPPRPPERIPSTIAASRYGQHCCNPYRDNNRCRGRDYLWSELTLLHPPVLLGALACVKRKDRCAGSRRASGGWPTLNTKGSHPTVGLGTVVWGSE